MHLMRWSAAVENWHRIHYDQDFAKGHDGLPDVVVSGSWKQNVLCQLLTDWAGSTGWVARMRFQYRSVDLVGDRLSAFGTVIAKGVVDGLGIVTVDMGIRNDRGVISTAGSAYIALPFTSKQSTPYPFPPVSTWDEDVAELELNEERPTIVGPELLALVGQSGPHRVAAEPVDASSIRRYFQATMDCDPLYYDVIHAAKSRYRGVVAPPLFPLRFRHLPGDSDPLDEFQSDSNFDGHGNVLVNQGLPPFEPGLPRMLNGGNEIELRENARRGDVIASDARIASIIEKQGNSGPLVFVTIASTYSVENRDALLLRCRQTYIFR
jgi:acyl dehydratase